jgi:hypothetical protein
LNLFTFVRAFTLGVGELLPMINNAPFWTGLVISSIIITEKKKRAAASQSQQDTRPIEEVEPLEPPEHMNVFEQEESRQRSTVDGIRAPQPVPRAANDNRLNQKLVA